MTARPKPLKVGILFGGRSAEHEVSVVSAQGVMSAIDADRFRAIPIGVTRQGTWLTAVQTQQALARIRAEQLRALEEPLGEGILHRLSALSSLRRLDVVFPLIHGINGEDGTLQGLLELAGVPYVGAGVAASALGMDKALQKTFFRHHDFPVVDDVQILVSQWRNDSQAVLRAAEATIGYPSFVKPANSGSSMDASPVGEITYRGEFYDYTCKYDDPATELHIPADIPQTLSDRLRELAVAAYRSIDCAGLARVDFFFSNAGDVYLNEVNTIPGFTPMSMYPKLWQHAGLSYRDLITRLIELALERHEEKGRAVR